MADREYDIEIHEPVEFHCPWCGQDSLVGITKHDGQELVVMVHNAPRCSQFDECNDPAHFILGIATRKNVN